MRLTSAIATLAFVLTAGVAVAQGPLANGNFDAAATDYKPVPVTANSWTSWTAGWGTMNNIETGAGAWIYNPSSVTEFGAYSFRVGGLDWQGNGASGAYNTSSGLLVGEVYTLDFKTHHVTGNPNGDWQNGFFEVGVIEGTPADVTDVGGGGDTVLALWKVDGVSGSGDWDDRSISFTAPAGGQVTTFIKLGRTNNVDTVLWVDEMVMTVDGNYSIYEEYGTTGVPFEGGLWGTVAFGSGNSVTYNETNSDHVVVTIDPNTDGDPWDITMTTDAGMDGQGSFDYTEGRGVGIDLTYAAANATRTDLFVGYFYGDGPGRFQSGVVLRAVGGASSNTSIYDFSNMAAPLATGVDFTQRKKIFFAVDNAGNIEVSVTADEQEWLNTTTPLATLGAVAIGAGDHNNFRVGSNSLQVASATSFEGTINIYRYGKDVDIVTNALPVGNWSLY